MRQVELGGVPIELTRLEFDLIDQFTADPQQVLTREQLMERVWGHNWFGGDHLVDVHIGNLRKKFAVVSDREIVRTVRGIGFCLAT